VRNLLEPAQSRPVAGRLRRRSVPTPLHARTTRWVDVKHGRRLDVSKTISTEELDQCAFYVVDFDKCTRDRNCGGYDYRLSHSLRRRRIKMTRALPSSTTDAGSGTGAAAVNSAHTARVSVLVSKSVRKLKLVRRSLRTEL